MKFWEWPMPSYQRPSQIDVLLALASFTLPLQMIFPWALGLPMFIPTHYLVLSSFTFYFPLHA